MSKRILLLGHPVKQSLSPAFQQAAFDHVGLPVRYELMDIPPKGLAAAVAARRGATRTDSGACGCPDS